MNIPNNIFREICIGSIRVYQKVISPFLPQSCRYHPSCSEYALQAVDEYGVWKGGLLAVKRLCRCHPWGGSGFDPVAHQMESDGSRFPAGTGDVHTTRGR